jgi:signal peptidase II
MILKKEHPLFVFSVSLILAGAIGNILDSAFYGLIFDKGTTFNMAFEDYMPYDGVAALNGKGYSPSMFGCVVDMFYFPMFEGRFPEWMPIWGGEDFQFFRPIFNFADASISCGVGLIILFQKKFSKTEEERLTQDNSSASSENKSENELNTNPT